MKLRAFIQMRRRVRRSGGEPFRRRSEQGYAAVELAILLPTLAMICFAAVDFGRLLGAYVSVANGAHQAALRAASGSGATAAEARLWITGERGNAAGSTHGCTIGDPAVDPAAVTVTVVDDATTKTRMWKVGVTCNFLPAVPIPLPGPIVIRTSAIGVERVK